MILWSRHFLITYFFLLAFYTGYSQNLYDLQHSVKFADYLFTSGQYKLAAEEYERVVFLDPENVDAKLRLIHSYKRAGNLSAGVDRILRFHDHQVENLNVSFADEFVEMNLKLKDYSQITNLLRRNTTLPKEFTVNSQLSILLLEAEWDKARNLVTEYPSETNKNLFEIVEHSMTLQYKSPLLGTTLSILLPGSGKIYAGRWKDGIISFIFIAGSAWQAYRGFDKFGTDSAFGWIFGGVSLGFYTGNIYGSWKAVKQYNTGLDATLQHQAEHSIYSDF